jgi:outer membrane protein assembly factor BamB
MQKTMRLCGWGVRVLGMLACAVAVTTVIRAEDWPYHRGKGNTGVWEETGILEKFPAEGLASRVRWRVPVKWGYSSPAVADGRVFVTDFEYTKRPFGIERAIAIDEQSGKILWTYQWDANYTGMSYDRGPKATPAVDGDRVYIQGAAGNLICFNVKTGEVIWQRNFWKEYQSPRQKWDLDFGTVAPPLFYGNSVIVKVGGEPNAKVVAFDKMTGKEIWRALSSDMGPAAAPMMIANAAGKPQLIVWHTAAISSLDPATGQVYWEYPWRIDSSMAVATPQLVGNKLFFSAYYQGALMLTLDQDKPGYKVMWKSNSESEVITDAVHVMIMTPIILGDYIYGIDTFGQLRCLDLNTGERIWETQQVTGERVRHSTAHFTRNGDRFFINNDMGELIIGKLSPKGYEEISRTQLIKPTTPASQRRKGGFITWNLPAYANKHIFIRNDEEIIRVSLAADAGSN